MNHQSVFHRMFFNAKEFNDYVKTDEFKAKYPEDYKVMASTTLSTRTMVMSLIL